MRQPSRAVSGATRAHPFPAFLLAIVALAVGTWAVLELVRARRLSEIGVGSARWIWISRSPEPEPVHFSALRAFELPSAPRSAEARIFVDRRFALWINGSCGGQGGQRPGDPIAHFDVSPFLRPGRNVVAVVAESPVGIGGLLFALQIGSGAPAVVSDGRWSIDPSGREISRPTGTPAVVLGRPPMFPWKWPRPR